MLFKDNFNDDITTSKFSSRIQLQKKQQQVELLLDTPAVHFDHSSEVHSVEKAGRYAKHLI